MTKQYNINSAKEAIERSLSTKDKADWQIEKERDDAILAYAYLEEQDDSLEKRLIYASSEIPKNNKEFIPILPVASHESINKVLTFVEKEDGTVNIGAISIGELNKKDENSSFFVSENDFLILRNEILERISMIESMKIAKYEDLTNHFKSLINDNTEHYISYYKMVLEEHVKRLNIIESKLFKKKYSIIERIKNLFKRQ